MATGFLRRSKQAGTHHNRSADERGDGLRDDQDGDEMGDRCAGEQGRHTERQDKQVDGGLDGHEQFHALGGAEQRLAGGGDGVEGQ